MKIREKFLKRGFAGKYFEFEGFRCFVVKEDGSPMLLTFCNGDAEEYWVMSDGSVQKGEEERSLPEFNPDKALPSCELMALYSQINLILRRFDGNEARRRLIAASGRGDEKTILDLFPKASLNQQELNRALIHAAEKQKTSLLQFLLDKNADINAKNSRQRSALHIAALRGDEETVDLLLKRGASINDCDEDQNSPLHLAVIHGRKKICEKLCIHGANRDLKNNKKKTPLDISDEFNFSEVSNLLRQRVSVTLPAATVDLTLGGVDVVGESTPETSTSSPRAERLQKRHHNQEI